MLECSHSNVTNTELALRARTQVPGNAVLHLIWGDFFTLIGFLVLIKPFRETFSPFMLMFNSLDRPEDRPHCLKWIIAGNIWPGLLMIMFFDWVFLRFVRSVRVWCSSVVFENNFDLIPQILRR